MRSEAEVRARLAIAQRSLPGVVESANLDPWSPSDAAALADVETRIELLTWMLEPPGNAEIVRVKVTHTDGRSFYHEPMLRPDAELFLARRDEGWIYTIEPFPL